MPTVIVLAFPRRVAEHLRQTTSGIQQSGKYFKRGGFARAVGTEKADEFTGFDLEADVIDGERPFILPVEETFDRTDNAWLFFIGAESFAKVAGFDGGHEVFR